MLLLPNEGLPAIDTGQPNGTRSPIDGTLLNNDLTQSVAGTMARILCSAIAIKYTTYLYGAGSRTIRFRTITASFQKSHVFLTWYH